MTVGIVGAGEMGALHAACWKEIGATVAAIYSISPAEQWAAHFGAQACTSLDRLIERVEVVDVCTPTDTHCQTVRAAAHAGRHILCEKPIARSMKQAQEMAALCRERGVTLMVGHVLRYFPEYASAHATVVQGDIGRVATMRLRRLITTPARSAETWYSQSQRSGGVLLDLMIHDFDYARWVAGEVVRVYAKRLGLTSGGQDHAIAILTHAGGAISHVEGSWAYPQGAFITNFEIAGSEGLITFDSRQTQSLTIQTHDHANAYPAGSPFPNSPYRREIEAFREAILTGSEPPIDVADAIASLEVALAAERSSETGRPVSLERR